MYIDSVNVKIYSAVFVAALKLSSLGMKDHPRVLIFGLDRKRKINKRRDRILAHTGRVGVRAVCIYYLEHKSAILLKTNYLTSAASQLYSCFWLVSRVGDPLY